MNTRKNIVVLASRTVSLSLLLALALPITGRAEEHAASANTNKPFSSMAITPDRVEECRVPRPPAELAQTAYLRNGYRAILRILVAERWQETGDCTCLLDQFTWDMALENFERFQTSDNPRLPFKVLDLYAMADALEAKRAEVCKE
jgi:hypothetical protein